MISGDRTLNNNYLRFTRSYGVSVNSFYFTRDTGLLHTVKTIIRLLFIIPTQVIVFRSDPRMYITILRTRDINRLICVNGYCRNGGKPL